MSYRAAHATTQGAIFAFKPASDSDQKPVRLTIPESGAAILGSSDFQPHGISLLPRLGHPAAVAATKRGWGAAAAPPPHLYAVNHRRDGEAVDVFEADAGRRALRPLASVRSPLFLNINDVAAVPGGFYVTNYHRHLPFTHPLSIAEARAPRRSCRRRSFA